MKATEVPDKYTGEYVESEILPEGASGSTSEKVVTMDEYISYDDVTDKHKEESVKAEVLPKKLILLKILMHEQVLILK